MSEKMVNVAGRSRQLNITDYPFLGGVDTGGALGTCAPPTMTLFPPTFGTVGAWRTGGNGFFIFYFFFCDGSGFLGGGLGTTEPKLVDFPPLTFGAGGVIRMGLLIII